MQQAAQQAAAEAAAKAAAQQAAAQAAAQTAAQEAARARAAAAAVPPPPTAEERREARLRAIGRQLDEEAAQRQAAADARPSAFSSLRRGRLFGRTDPNTELVLYAEAMARRIQLNTGVGQVQAIAQRPHTAPVVTLAIRRDGTLESISFVTSSGVPEVDEAVRRIVLGVAPFPAFSEALARDYDVVEIRRTWRFDSAVRLD